jgi:hypothetical protein
MNTPTDDIDPEQWLSAMPAPPTAVCARLNQAGVNASWHPRHYNTPGSGGDLFIESTFSRFPLIKQILIESGVKRSKWPRPPRWRQRKGTCRFRLQINYSAAGPAVPSTVCLKLTQEQRLKLEQYAQSLNQTPQKAAQALFNNALNAVFLAQVAATDENASSAGTGQ